MTNLVSVVVGPDTHPVQVDDFPEGCERSCKGALYFTPTTLMDITVAELAHVQAKHADLAATLRVLPAKPEPSIPLRPTLRPTPTPTPMSTPTRHPEWEKKDVVSTPVVEAEPAKHEFVKVPSNKKL